MRRKRFSPRKSIQRFTVRCVLSLLPVAMLGVLESFPPTYAMFTGISQTKNIAVSSAFIFPKTVKEIVERASDAASHASQANTAANDGLEKCKLSSVDAHDTAIVAKEVQSAADAARSQVSAIQGIALELQADLARAEAGVQPWQTLMANQAVQEGHLAAVDNSVQQNYAAAQKVYAYVDQAYQQVSSLLTQANNAALTAQKTATDAMAIVQEKKDAEEKAAAEKRAAKDETKSQAAAKSEVSLKTDATSVNDATAAQ